MASMAQIGAITQVWNFPKLKGQENYHSWAKKMREALKYNALWDIVNEAQVVPPLVANATPEQLQTHQTAVATWKTMNAEAGGLIHSMCEEKPADKIEDLSTATERWMKLKTDYISSGFVNRLTKLEDLWHLRPNGSENSIETYIANIRSKAEQLKEMGSPISEWIVVSILLSNLDIKYKNFKHRLLTSGLEKNPSFDQVIPLLLAEERLLKREHREQAALATASGKGKNNRGNSSKNSNGNTNRNNDLPPPSKNPNSPNYKGEGEAPECSKGCTPKANGRKKRHWPYDCWTLHKDRIPKRYRNRIGSSNSHQPQASAANESNRTYFSAQAWTVNDEHQLDHYDFWGLKRPEKAEQPLEYTPSLAGVSSRENAIVLDSPPTSPLCNWLIGK